MSNKTITWNLRKTLSIISIFLFGALAGGIAGAYFASHVLSSLFTSGSVLSNTVAIKQNVSVLKSLHEDEIEKAKEQLETDLDAKLIFFSTSIHGSGEMRKKIIDSLKFARDYRTKHPRVTNYPDIDKAVGEAFAEADQNK